MATPETQNSEPKPSKVQLILIRIWNYTWFLLFGVLTLGGFARPRHPDPAHGLTEELKTFPGVVYVSPQEMFAFNFLVGFIFVAGIFVVMPISVALYLERRKQRAR